MQLFIMLPAILQAALNHAVFPIKEAAADLSSSGSCFSLQEDLAIVLDNLAVLDDVLHNSVDVPLVFLVASSILLAQFAQSTSIL